MIKKIDISHETIFFITGFLLSLWILFLIRDIILIFFVGFIFMSTLSPLVSKLTRLKVPKIVAIAMMFLLIISFIVGVITVGFTPLISQTSNLSNQLAESSGLLIRSNFIDQSLIQQELTNASRQIISFTIDALGNLISFISVIVITFYLLLDREKIEDHISSLFVGRQEKARKLLDRIENKLGAWLRGQLILSVVVGLLVYGGLTILGVNYALPLAIIAGLLEVVPVIGPIISAIPAVLVALTISPLMTGLVVGLYLLIQQLENQIIVPQVMKRAVGLNPLLVILAVSVGGRLLGVGGALLAVPIAVVIQLIAEEVLNTENR